MPRCKHEIGAAETATLRFRRSTKIDTIKADTSPKDILALAIEAESGAVKTYAAFANAVVNPLAKAKFRYLSKEEEYHRQVLRARYKKVVGTAYEPDDKGGAQSEVAVDLDENVDNLDALEMAITAEEEAQRLYRQAADATSDPAGKAMFQQLVKDEERHKAALQSELRVLKNQWYWSSIEGSPWIEKDFWGG